MISGVLESRIGSETYFTVGSQYILQRSRGALCGADE